MKLKQALDYYYSTWWRPVIAWLLVLALFVAAEFISPGGLFSSICFLINLLAMFGIIRSCFKQSDRKNTGKAFISLFVFLLSLAVFVFILIYGMARSLGPDHYADGLVIPDSIEVHSPIPISGSQRPDSVLERKVSITDFQLYSSFQPGCFEFDFWTAKIDSGLIFLKVFEVTKNEELSDEGFAEIFVYNPTNEIKRFGTNGYFVIYEGDWGKPYAARFEVWFRPKSRGTERKLLVKNYKIEGWQH